jgi:hypothetical protein
MIDEENEELTEDTFTKWHREWEEEHPIQNWIDINIFHNESIAHLRATYALSHPWKIAEYIWYEIYYAWQRVFRGWDDRIIWSIDWHLAESLPVWLREFKKNKTGVPSMMFHEGDEIVHEDGSVFPSDETIDLAKKEWDEILDKIIVGFESYIKHEEYGFKTPEEEAELVRKFEEGFDLFHKYWGCFWD